VKNLFQTFAAYNRWANGRLYRVVSTLPDEWYREHRWAYFGSIHGTLNHILVGDRIWLYRLTGTGEAPARLDEILFESLADLQAARDAEDVRLIEFVSELDETRLSASFAYTNMTGEQFEQPLQLVLAHVFNHQTHHRGQAHTLLTQFGWRPPELDLIFFLREPALVA
jgi:uncharacterized damage-inducible protein DinB